jgi:hypothetical protein
MIRSRPKVEAEPERALPNLSTMTIAAVLAAVDAGELDVIDAIAAEKRGKARKTLLSALRAR